MSYNDDPSTSSSEQSYQPAELPLITLTTPEKEILTRSSSLNPYPSKATGGITFGGSMRPTQNPQVIIHYPASGETYRTTLPISTPEEQIELPSPLSDIDIDPVTIL